MKHLDLVKVLLLGGLLLLGAVSFGQQRAIQALRAELAGIGASVDAPTSSAPVQSEQRPGNIVRVAGDQGSANRLARLEQMVEELARATDHLMERGAVPLSADKAQMMQARFFDTSLSNNERLKALALLRRNGGLNDDVLTASVNWMQSATNANLRRELLQQMEGSTNSILKQPLLTMLENENSDQVREEAVERLRSFVDDPAVEDKLWQLAVSDPEGDVREEAMEALTEGKVSETRLAAFKTLAIDPSATADERVAALQALRRANGDSPEIIAKVAELAMNSTDPGERGRLFGVFDGMRDESLKAPLVNGLQDPNPGVRERAADALSGMAADPVVNQWLQHISQNDPDPQVRREAGQALAEAIRGGRAGGRGRGGR